MARGPGLERLQHQLVDGDPTRLALHDLAPAGPGVQALAVDLHRRHHRGHLVDLADELLQDRADVLLGQVRRVGLGDHGPVGVLGVGLAPEHHRRRVRLAPLLHELHQPGGAPHGAHEHAGGGGVERAGVADTTDAERPAHPRDHVVGRHARRACRPTSTPLTSGSCRRRPISGLPRPARRSPPSLVLDRTRRMRSSTRAAWLATGSGRKRSSGVLRLCTRRATRPWMRARAASKPAATSSSCGQRVTPVRDGSRDDQLTVQRRPVHGRVLLVGGDLDVGDGDEVQPRVGDVLLDDLRDRLLDVLVQPSVPLGHVVTPPRRRARPASVGEQPGGRVHVVGVHARRPSSRRRSPRRVGSRSMTATTRSSTRSTPDASPATTPTRERRTLPAVPEAHLGDADLQPVAQRRLRAVEHRTLALERGDARQVHVDAHRADVHPTRIVGRAHTRSTSTVSKTSNSSPTLMSLNLFRPMPHSKPSRTSLTSSLNRRSDYMVSSAITTPSRMTRTPASRLTMPA